MPGQFVLLAGGIGGILRMDLAFPQQITVFRQIQQLALIIGKQVNQGLVHVIHGGRPLLQQRSQVRQVAGFQIIIEGRVPLHDNHVRIFLAGQQHLQPVGIDAHQLNGRSGSFRNRLQHGGVQGRHIRHVRHINGNGNRILTVQLLQLFKGHTLLTLIGLLLHVIALFAAADCRQQHGQ